MWYVSRAFNKIFLFIGLLLQFRAFTLYDKKSERKQGVIHIKKYVGVAVSGSFEENLNLPILDRDVRTDELGSA